MKAWLAALGFVLFVCPVADAQSRGTRAATPSAAPQAPVKEPVDAVKEFQDRLDGYVELRARLAKKLEPLSPTANASELATRQEALANAIKAARKGARNGDLIPATVAAQLLTIVQNDFRGRPVDGEDQDAPAIIDESVGADDRSFRARAPQVSPLEVGHPQFGVIVRREFAIAVRVGEHDPVRDGAAQ